MTGCALKGDMLFRSKWRCWRLNDWNGSQQSPPKSKRISVVPVSFCPDLFCALCSQLSQWNLKGPVWAIGLGTCHRCVAWGSREMPDSVVNNRAKLTFSLALVCGETEWDKYLRFFITRFVGAVYNIERGTIPFFLLLFRAAPTVYGGSQARGWIRAVAASLHHSHTKAGSELSLWPTPQLTARPDP